MIATEIRKYQRQAPFKPFTLVLSTGAEIPVPHPDFLWIPRGNRIAMVSTTEQDYEIIDLIHVVSIRAKERIDSEDSQPKDQ